MSHVLHVGNLHRDMTSADLRTLFARYGGVESAEVVIDPIVGTNRGFGFVRMNSEASCASAIREINGHTHWDHVLTVKPVDPLQEAEAKYSGGFRANSGRSGKGNPSGFGRSRH